MHGVSLVSWSDLVVRDWFGSNVGCEVVCESLHRKEIISVRCDFESQLRFVIICLCFNTILESEFIQLHVVYC